MTACRIIVRIAAILAASVAVNLAAVHALPSAITYFSFRGLYNGKALGKTFEDNRLYHGKIKRAPKDIVPLDNPDNLSSFAIYDVSRHPVRIRAAVSRGAPYWSIALTAYNTDSFYVVNDRQVSGDTVSVVITRMGDSFVPCEGDRVVAAPSEKGIVLVRTILPQARDGAALEALMATQTLASMEPATSCAR